VRSELERIRKRAASKPRAVILLPMIVALSLGTGAALLAEFSATGFSGSTEARAVSVTAATTLILLTAFLLTLFLRSRHEPIR
jgi:hypothetical protein